MNSYEQAICSYICKEIKYYVVPIKTLKTHTLKQERTCVQLTLHLHTFKGKWDKLVRLGIFVARQ